MKQLILGLLLCGSLQMAWAKTDAPLRLLDLLAVSSFIEPGSASETALLESLEQNLAPELLAKTLELLSAEDFLDLLEKELQASKETTKLKAYSIKLDANTINQDRLVLIKELLLANQFLMLLQEFGIYSVTEKQLLHFYLYCYRYTPSEKISLQIKRYNAPEVQAALLVLRKALQSIAVPADTSNAL